MAVDTVDDPEFPQGLREQSQWLLWKSTDGGRKVPRAPWNSDRPLQFVSAMDPANWTDFETARDWQQKLPHNLGLAYALTRQDETVFIDLDDVVIDGKLVPSAAALVQRADSYAALSTSGTGVHIFVAGQLSEDVKALTGPLTEDADPHTGPSLEAYDRNRFIAMTGDHITEAPEQIRDGTDLIDSLEDEHAEVSADTPDQVSQPPSKSPETLRSLESTSDIQDVFDAISQTTPDDIRMRSSKTREHRDGTASYDPSWCYSESGTRLGVVDNGWIYRKGMIYLDALQLVALEEGILTDERDYPAGDDFWDAVDALRDRGAHIPEYDPTSQEVETDDEKEPPETVDRWEVAARINYGQQVRTHVHPYDRSYQEELALELAPVFVDAGEVLGASPAIVYRAAELYATGHKAGVIPGKAHEATIGAGFRIATIEAGMPRPLDVIGEAVNEHPKDIRQKFHRLVSETSLADSLNPADLVVEPTEYVPYVASEIGYGDDEQLQAAVRDRLNGEAGGSGADPLSKVAAAFYAVGRQSKDHNITQKDVAYPLDISTVTLRNHYQDFLK